MWNDLRSLKSDVHEFIIRNKYCNIVIKCYQFWLKNPIKYKTTRGLFLFCCFLRCNRVWSKWYVVFVCIRFFLHDYHIASIEINFHLALSLPIIHIYWVTFLFVSLFFSTHFHISIYFPCFDWIVFYSNFPIFVIRQHYERFPNSIVELKLARHTKSGHKRQIEKHLFHHNFIFVSFKTNFDRISNAENVRTKRVLRS